MSAAIRSEIARVIVGNDDVVRGIVTCLMLLLVGSISYEVVT